MHSYINETRKYLSYVQTVGMEWTDDLTNEVRNKERNE